jgi:hypothetical protein
VYPVATAEEIIVTLDVGLEEPTLDISASELLWLGLLFDGLAAIELLDPPMLELVGLIEEIRPLLKVPWLDATATVDDEAMPLLERLVTPDDVGLLLAIADIVVETGPVYR